MERYRSLQQPNMGHTNYIACLAGFFSGAVLSAKAKVGGKICARSHESVYRYCVFCMVWNRTDSEVFCPTLVFALRHPVFMGKLQTEKLVSILLGNSFPQMVTYIMPCPVVSLSIAVYSGYQRKNRLLLALLTIWGLTGVKSILFNAYEDIILLVCGLYGITLLVREVRRSKAT